MLSHYRVLSAAFVLVLAIALLVCLGPVPADGSLARASDALGLPAHSVAGSLNRMRVIAEHHYRMLAKVRPLLFWIERDNIGGARIQWRGDDNGGRGFELLIGSDPGRAPRRINRWGYIAEEVGGSRASTFGVMKQSKEESIEDAKAQLGREGGEHVFKAIRTTATDGRATSSVSTITVVSDFTYRDLDSLLARLDDPSLRPSVRTVNVPVGTRPGFLVALAELIEDPELKSVPYVYNGRFHRLHRKGVISVSQRVDGRDVPTLRSARFETENRATRERTAFSVTYSVSGDLAGIPVHILYQPKWWIQVELFLDDDEAKFWGRR